jgi:hypothetical protein
MPTEHTEYTEYVYTHVGNGHASLISGYHTCNARGVCTIPGRYLDLISNYEI